MFDISHNITSGKYELVYGEYGRVATTIQKYSTVYGEEMWLGNAVLAKVQFVELYTPVVACIYVSIYSF